MSQQHKKGELTIRKIICDITTMFHKTKIFEPYQSIQFQERPQSLSL